MAAGASEPEPPTGPADAPRQEDATSPPACYKSAPRPAGSVSATPTVEENSMSSYTETRQIAALHRTQGTVETADPGSIRIMIGFAKAAIKDDELVIASYRQCGDEPPSDLTEAIQFWQEYIEWGEPIVTHWWGKPSEQ